MVETRVVLAGVWVAVMLTYLLGDVLRIFAGDFEPGKLAGGMRATPLMWLVIAALMLIPILMLVLTLTVDYAGDPLAEPHRRRLPHRVQSRGPALSRRL